MTLDYPLLESKITVPALPGWAISRPRLTRRIARGAAGPVTLVTGPPGAGKTTALASWAATAGPERVAWVTLDDYDNQPGSFWANVTAALHRAGVTVPGGAAGDPGRLAPVLAAQPLPVVLVLDDLQEITAPRLLAELASMLGSARPGLRLIAAVRKDPLLPLRDYRAAGELTEIRAAELSFTVPEAAKLMTQHGITLPAEELGLITRRVAGWAAGLRLAALSLDNHPDPALVIKNLTAEDSAITSYLVAEVLDAQPAAARELMLRTSILERVSAGLAGELADDEQAASTLTALARSNAFVEALGDGWYRVHPLLAEVLRLMLMRDSPRGVPRLHQRAARWYLRNGLASQALTHMAQLSDWAFTAEIVVDELAVGDLIEPSGGSPLADLLRQLPRLQVAPQVQATPQSLLAAAALQLPDAQDQACARLLDAAEQLLAHLPAGQEIPSRLAAAQIRFALARRSGDLDGIRSAAAAGEAMFGQLPDDLRTRHPRTRALVLSAVAAADMWSGNLAAATAAFRAAMAAAPQGSYEQAACRGHLALIEALHGQLNRAAELAAAAMAPPFGRSVPAATVALALVHLQRHEPAAWHRRLRQANAVLQARPDRLTSALTSLAAARAAVAESRGPAAADLLRRARQGWSPPPWLDHLLTVTESRVHAAAGDVQAALDAAARAQTLETETLGTGGTQGTGPPLATRVAGARAWLAAGDLQAARQALAGPAGAPGLGTLIEAHVTGALISYRDGDAAQGRRSLERAMRLGEPEEYRLPFVTDWTWIRPVLRDDPDLISGFRALVAQPAAATPADAATPDLVITEQLSDRELEVLQRTAAMYSTEEIAGELFISVNTVKTHLKSIYRKLGAAGRRDAVRRARQLKLM